MSSTRVSRHVNAPRARVYRALLDAQAVATWKVPTGMRSRVHEFDGREGGSFRVSLTYDEPTGSGKTTFHTDTYHGRFVELVEDEKVVEVVEFETADPALGGEMTITTALADAAGGTDVLAVHDGLSPGVPVADNEAGWREALAKLAALVEAGESTRPGRPWSHFGYVLGASMFWAEAAPGPGRRGARGGRRLTARRDPSSETAARRRHRPGGPDRRSVEAGDVVQDGWTSRIKIARRETKAGTPEEGEGRGDPPNL